MDERAGLFGLDLMTLSHCHNSCVYDYSIEAFESKKAG